MRYEPIDPQLFVRNRERLRALLKPDLADTAEIVPESVTLARRVFSSTS